MDTIAALFGALASGLRWLFDLGAMAVGIAPTAVQIGAVAVPFDGPEVVGQREPHPLDDPFQQSQAEREYYGLWS